MPYDYRDGRSFPFSAEFHFSWKFRNGKSSENSRNGTEIFVRGNKNGVKNRLEKFTRKN